MQITNKHQAGHPVDAELPALPAVARDASITSTGIDCAKSLKRTADVTRLARALAGLVTNESLSMLPYSRSQYMGYAAGLLRKAGDDAGASALVRARVAFLARARAAAPFATARVPLASQMMATVEPGADRTAVIEALMDAERTLPGDYEMSFYLALQLAMANRVDEAMAAMDRAIAKAHYPRRFDMQAEKAKILRKHGDPREAAVIADALANGPTAGLHGYLAEVVEGMRARQAEIAREPAGSHGDVVAKKP